jgi:hypothetical protein
MRAARSPASRLLIAAAAVTLAAPALAGPNLLSNASFESPALTPGSNFLVLTTDIAGWALSGSQSPGVALIEESYSLPDAEGRSFAAADGRQFLDLTGNGTNGDAGIMATINLPAGSYSVSFAVGNYGGSSSVSLSINGGPVSVFSNTSSSSTNVVWQTFSVDFNSDGASAATTLDFRNLDAPTDNFNGFDNVVLTAAAVPEPASWVLMLVGLGLFARRQLPR